MRVLLIGLLFLGAGCANFPEVDAVEGPDVDRAPYPALVPLETLVAADGSDEPTVSPETQTQLTRRAEALQARAARLARQPVVASDARTRMEDGVTDQP